MTDWWTGNDKKVAADTKIVYDFAYKVIHRRRVLEEKTGVNGGGVVHDMSEGGDGETGAKRPEVLSSSGKDLMQLFMEATDEKGERLTDEDLKDTLINFLLVSFLSFGRFFFIVYASYFSLLLLASMYQEELVTAICNEDVGDGSGLNIQMRKLLTCESLPFSPFFSFFFNSFSRRPEGIRQHRRCHGCFT